MLSQSAVDGFAVFLAIGTLTYLIQNKLLKQSYPAFPWKLLAAWVFVVAIGFFDSPATWQYGLSRVFEFKWIFFFYLLFRYLLLTKPKPESFVRLSWVLLPVLIYSVAISLLGVDPFSDRDVETGIMRAGGFFSNPMFFAHVFGILLCIYGGQAIGKIRFGEKVTPLEWAVIVAGGAAMLLTMTRGIWLAGFFALLVMLFYVSRKVVGIFLVIAFLVLSGMYVGWPEFRNRLHFAFAEGSYDQERINLWTANWEIIKENPVIGVGYGANKLLLDPIYDRLGITEFRMHSHAHNQVIHLTAGTGIIGVMIFLILCGYFLLLTHRLYKSLSTEKAWHKRLLIGSMGGQVCFLLGGLFEANFEHGRVKYALMIAWALALWIASENNFVVFGKSQKPIK